MTEQAQTFTDADVDSLAEKLGRFAADLTPGERACLTALVGLAAGADDVRGHSDGAPSGVFEIKVLKLQAAPSWWFSDDVATTVRDLGTAVRTTPWSSS